jgi:hypothetical protein
MKKANVTVVMGLLGSAAASNILICPKTSALYRRLLAP